MKFIKFSLFRTATIRYDTTITFKRDLDNDFKFMIHEIIKIIITPQIKNYR